MDLKAPDALFRDVYLVFAIRSKSNVRRPESGELNTLDNFTVAVEDRHVTLPHDRGVQVAVLAKGHSVAAAARDSISATSA